MYNTYTVHEKVQWIIKSFMKLCKCFIHVLIEVLHNFQPEPLPYFLVEHSIIFSANIKGCCVWRDWGEISWDSNSNQSLSPPECSILRLTVGFEIPQPRLHSTMPKFLRFMGAVFNFDTRFLTLMSWHYQQPPNFLSLSPTDTFHKLFHIRCFLY